MAFHNIVGKRGEDAACAFLKRAGYRVLERTVRTRWSELDIVCLNERGELVFVEVKSREENGFGAPEDAYSRDKRARLARAATAYAVSRQYTGLYHIDAVCVVFAPGGRAVIRITHHKDIV